MSTIFTVTRDIEVEGSSVEIEVTASHDDGSEYESLTVHDVGEKVLDEYEINIDRDDIAELDKDEVGELLTVLYEQHSELVDKIIAAEPEPDPEPEPEWRGSEEAHLREPLLKCNLSAEEFEMNAVNVGELASWLLHPENDGKLDILITELFSADLGKTRTALITAVIKQLSN